MNNSTLQFTGVSSEEEALLIVQTEPSIVASFPENLLTDNVLFEALSRDYKVYGMIDKVFFTDTLINRLIINNPQHVFDNLNISLIKPHHLISLVKSDGLAIQFVPHSMLTTKICSLAIEQNVEAHDHVPLQLRDAEYINKLILQAPEYVRRIDIAQRDPEILKKVVIQHPFVISYMTMTDRTPEICETIMRADPSWIAYFPEKIYDNREMLEKICELPYFKQPSGEFNVEIIRPSLAEYLLDKDINYYKHLPNTIKTSDMAFKAVEHDALNILITPTSLKKNGKLWEIALKQDPQLYTSIPLNEQSDSIRIFIAREKARKHNTTLEHSLANAIN